MQRCILVLLLCISHWVYGHGEDDPLLTMVMVDQLELRQSDGDSTTVFEGDAWLGKDLKKLWLKAEVEKAGGHTEEAELQVLYSHAIKPYWDVQVGLRKDFLPNPDNHWAVIGIHGLAPYFFDIDAALFIGESGQTGLRLEAEYEWLFTQKLILAPEMEMNIYGKNDESIGIGAGLADIELGLRLRYEIRRKIAPYIGINWTKKFGNTADYAEHEGEVIEDTQFVAGIHAWF